MIAEAIAALPIPRSRAHVIIGTSLLTDSDCYVTTTKTAAGEQTYRLAPPGMSQLGDGDGTVLNSSNVYRRADIDEMSERAHLRRYPSSGHSELCTNERVFDLLKTLL
jgi:hypothetical protein